jgi:choline kinase
VLGCRSRMDAVIYAAGRALRLGARSAECPKILLRFGGCTLLERHVRLLAHAGVERVFVVTGHLRERIGNVLPALAAKTGIQVVEVFNPEFTAGSVLSVGVSIPVLRAARGAVLVMDGDVLYDQRMLQRLVDSPGRSVLLLDRSYSTEDDDPVLVPVRGGRPFEFRKRWQGTAEVVGESIGFFRVREADVPMLIEDTEARARGAGKGDSYDEVIRTLVKAGRFDFEEVTGLPWTEVDFETDIDYGRETILPQLLRLPGVGVRRRAPGGGTAVVPPVGGESSGDAETLPDRRPRVRARRARVSPARRTA